MKHTKMHFKIIGLLLVSRLTNVLCDDDKIITDMDKNDAYFYNPKDDSCGLIFGGAMVQLVTNSYYFSDGTIWDQDIKSLLFVDRYNASIYKYDINSGISSAIYIEELENTEVAAVYRVQGWKNRLVILANNSVYIFKTEIKNDEQIHSIKKVFDITDESRVLTKSCVTVHGHIAVGTQPKDHEADFPNVEKGKGEFIAVNLKYKNVTVLGEGYTVPSSIIADVYNKYRYQADMLENKIWKSKVAAGSEPEVVFDMEDFKDVLTGWVTAIALDRENNLWIAFSQSYEIIKFDYINQRITHRIPITVPIVNSLCWGGPKYNVLFAGTNAKYIKNKLANPAAGAIIAITGTGSRGWYQHEVIVAEDWLE